MKLLRRSGTTFSILSILWIAIISLLIGCGCGGGSKDPVIGVPSKDAVELTPSAAQLGLRKFEGKSIMVKMDYVKEIDSEIPDARKLIFRGEEREFAVILSPEKYEELADKIQPGKTFRIYGVLKQSDKDKYLQLLIQ